MKIRMIFLHFFYIAIPLVSITFGQNKQEISDVDFTIIRLEYSSYEIIGFYEFSEKFRKSLPEESYNQVHNIYYRINEPSDFGNVSIKSILTGEQIVYISTFWPFGAVYDFPADSQFTRNYQNGFSSHPPDTLIKLFVSDDESNKADSAWSLIMETDIVHRMAINDKYEVYVIHAEYSNEWLILLNSRPVAPLDMSIIGNGWPKKYITRNINTIPEIIVHNFSDTILSLNSHLNIYQSNHLIYASKKDVTEIKPDSSKLILFDPVIGNGSEPYTFSYELTDMAGNIWQDAASYNDTLNNTVIITTNPVFRPISTFKHPGSIPVRGFAYDFDDDMDIDIIQDKSGVKFWQNINGLYYDITEKSDFKITADFRSVVITDLNNDNHSDILLICYDSSPVLLKGNGSDFFTDITDEAGLSDVIGYWDVEAFDFENDDDIDLIFQSKTQEEVLLNDGTGHFTDITSSSGISDNGQTEGITANDLNNDGFKDVIITNWGSIPKLFINNKNGTFTFQPGPWDFIYGRMSLIFDYDNDGFKDILFSLGHRDDMTLLYRNKGNLTFDTPIELAPSFHADVADINKDGRLDIILDHLSDLTLLLNQEKSFTDVTHLLVDMENEISEISIGTPPQASFVDLDNDNDLDIYSKIFVFKNQGVDTTLSYLEESSNKSIPDRFKLLQNHPNPFNPGTTIDFELYQKTEIDLTVFDIQGRMIGKLIEGIVPQGKHSVPFNGQKLASGLYFYRLKSKDFEITKKMLLIK